MNQPMPRDFPLEASEERFRLLVESVKDYAIFMLDPGGRVLTWNAGAQRIKGYTAQEIIGKHFSIFYPQETVERGHPQEELEIAKKEGRFEEEGWRVRKDGSFFWANVVITALYDDSKNLRGFGKVTRDLTQRREQEESLRRSEERFRLLVEGVTDYAVFMLDANGYVVTWNAGAQRIKGYAASEIIGEHFSKFYPEDAIASRWPQHVLEAAAEGHFEEEGWRVRKDGTRFLAHVSITALHDEAGRLRGFAKLTRDLSERSRTEALELDGTKQEALLEAERSARLQAQRAVRIKDEFLATLSHELRSPLSAILGWTQILRSPRPIKPEDVARGLEVIERNARAQVQLIDDLLDLSRVMAGRIKLDSQHVLLADIVRDAVESAQPSAVAKGVSLESTLNTRDAVISGEPTRLLQIISNLLGNAIKFTPAGGRVQVQLDRMSSHAELTVADTGIGIAPDYLSHVFDRFSQQDSSASRRHGGLGLGLAIAKQLVELHGGTIHAKSAGEGKGSTFIVMLPLIDAEDTSGRPISRTELVYTDSSTLPRLPGARILVVDDELDARELLMHVLTEQGARITTASSAAEALRILETSTPDLMICDIGMPEMDGLQLIRKIRAGEARGRQLPALALTAFARIEDRKQAMLAGYQSHLAKPFDPAELIIIVHGLLNRAR